LIFAPFICDVLINLWKSWIVRATRK